MTSKKKPAASKKAASKKKSGPARGRGKNAAPAPADEKRYPDDLGMRWFHQGAHLPDDAHDTEKDDDNPSGRLRLTRTAPGGWGKPQ